MRNRILSAILACFMTINTCSMSLNSPEKTKAVEVDNSNVTITGSDSFSDILADTLKNHDNDNNDDEFSSRILGVKLEDDNAVVSYEADIDCTAVLAIYDDTGETMLYVYDSEISSLDNVVSIPVYTKTLPQYFVVKVYLVDTATQAPLSKVYEDIENTRTMVDFNAKSIEDFEGFEVINLDESNESNFLVYSQNTKVFKESSEVNILVSEDDENGVYTFENIDEGIRNLKSGEIISYELNSENPVIIKVKDIKINGSKAEIYSDNVTIDEIFTFVKIEEVSNEDNTYMDTEGNPNIIESNLDVTQSALESASYYGPENKNWDLSLDFSEKNRDDGVDLSGQVKIVTHIVKDEHKETLWKNKENTKSVKIKGEYDASFELSVKAEVKIYVDTKEKVTTDNIEWSKIFSVSVCFTASISGDFEASDKINSDIPLVSFQWLINGVIVNFAPTLKLSVSGKGTFSAAYEHVVGMKLSHDQSGNLKYDNISKNPSVKFEFGAAITISIGIDVGPDVSVLNANILKIDFEISATAKAKGTPEIEAFDTSNIGEKKVDRHSCLDYNYEEDSGNSINGCVKISVDLTGKIGVSVDSKLLDIFMKNEKKKWGCSLSLNAHISDYYYSIKYDDYGKGFCPHKQYYYTITAKDRNGNPVEDADVIVNLENKVLNDNYKTDKDGKVIVFLNQGTNSIKISKDNIESLGNKFVVKVNQKDDKNKISNSIGYSDEEKEDKVSDVSYSVGNIKTEITINGDTSRESTIVLKPKLYPVTIKILDEDNNPLNGAEAVSDYKYAKEDKSHDASFFRGKGIIALPEGEYNVTASAYGYESLTKKVKVFESNNSEVIFTLKSEASTLEIKDQYDNPVVNARIDFKNTQGEEFTDYTDEKGILVRYLEPESYEINVALNGYDAFSDKISVPDKGSSFDYIMHNNLKLVTVMVTDENQNPLNLVSVYNYFNNRTVETDVNGKVSLYLPEGNISLRLLKSGYTGQKVYGIVDNSNESKLTYKLKKTGSSEDADSDISYIFDKETGVLKIEGNGSVVFNQNWEFINDVNEIRMNGCLDFDKFYFSSRAPGVFTSITSKGSRFQSFPNLKRVYISDYTVSLSDGLFTNCKSLEYVFVPNSVKEMENGVFLNCKSLKEVTIPGNIDNEYLFKYCDNLEIINICDESSVIKKGVFSKSSVKTIIIPDSVSEIEAEAFKGCTQLEKVNIPDKITEIPDGLFSECISIKNIEITDSVKKIGDSVFKGCTQLEYVKLPDSIEEIGDSMFSGCTQLEKVNIPNKLTALPNGMFYNCTSLKSINIPNNVEKIGRSAFGMCTQLKFDNLSKNIWNIEENAFRGCTIQNLKVYDYSKVDDKAFAECLVKTLVVDGNTIPSCVRTVGAETIILPETITEIHSRDLSGQPNLKSISIPFSVTEIGDNTFVGCKNLIEVTIPDSVVKVGKSVFRGCDNLQVIKVADGSQKIGSQMIPVCPEVKRIEIPYGVKTIEEIAFYGCENLKDIVIPTSVISIGDNAFEGCKSFEEIEIPGSVMNVGKSIFKDCTNLKTVKIGKGRKTLTRASVGGSAIAENVVISDDVVKIDNDAFYNCYMENVVIPEGVTSIGDRAFISCGGLKEITIPKTVQSIGKEAFKWNEDLEKITILSNLTIIDDEMFSHCRNLKELTIPDSVKSIGKEAFYDCTLLSNLTIPDNVQLIGERAFENCSSLTEIVLPDGIQSIGDRAFSFCGFKEIIIPEKVQNIGYQAFAWCPLSKVVLPSNIQSLDGATFANCDTLTDVVLPGNIKNIGEAMFYGCKEIKKINIPDSVTTIGDSAFSGCSSLSEVKFPDNIQSIGEKAFSGCESITKINIPNSVRIIGNDAFSNCTSLSEVAVPGINSRITSSIFQGCPVQSLSITNGPINSSVLKNIEGSITELNLHDIGEITNNKIFSGLINLEKVSVSGYVKSIGNNVFSDLSKLTDVSVSSNIDINNGFNFCSNLKHVKFENGVRVARGFVGCTALTDISFNEDLEEIADSAFVGCTSLETLIIPDSVKSIGISAFSGCTKLSDISAPKKIENIGNKAFDKCPGWSSPNYRSSTSLNGIAKNVPIESFVSSADDLITSGYTKLSDISVPKKIENIKNKAFDKCPDWSSPNYRSSTSLNGIVKNDSEKSVVSSMVDLFADTPENCEDSDDTIEEIVLYISDETYDIALEGSEKINDASLEKISGLISGDTYNTYIVKSLESENILSSDNLLYMIQNEADTNGEILIPDGVISKLKSEKYEYFSVHALYNIDIADIEKSTLDYNGEKQVPDISLKHNGVLLKENVDYTLENEMDSVNPGVYYLTVKGSGNYYGSVSVPFVIKSEHSDYVVNNGVLVSGKNEEHVVIPDGVTKIADSAFASCEKIITVKLPESVKEIGANAFYNCTNLKSVEIPDTVDKLGVYSFGYVINGFSDPESLDDFVISGYGSSVAETYADLNNLLFKDLKSAVTTESGLTTETEPVTTGASETTLETNPVTTAVLETTTETEPITTAVLETTSEMNPVTTAVLETTTEIEPVTTAVLETTTETEPVTTVVLETTAEPKPITTALVTTSETEITATTTAVTNNTDEIVSADADGNGVVNSVDIVVIISCIINGNFDKRADINGDGKMDVVDLVALKKILLK